MHSAVGCGKLPCPVSRTPLGKAKFNVNDTWTESGLHFLKSRSLHLPENCHLKQVISLVIIAWH